jgi:hypothetical protein
MHGAKRSVDTRQIEHAPVSKRGITASKEASACSIPPTPFPPLPPPFHSPLPSLHPLPPTHAPAPYQKGPLTPYCHATLELCKSVAAHVHWEQTTAAMSPVLTLRPAVLKCSLVMCVPPYLAVCVLGGRVGVGGGSIEIDRVDRIDRSDGRTTCAIE